MSRPLVALAALLLAPAARAHDFWVEPTGAGFVFRVGHRGGELLPLDAAKVRTVRCAAGGAAPEELRARATAAGKELRLPARCAAVSASLHGGFYSLTPDGEVNRPRDEVPDAVRSWESRQFAKWLDAADPAAARPLGDELEIVPVSDLAKARQGAKATFRVLHQGRPLPGAAFSMGHRLLGETDGEGEVRVRIRAADVESVSVSVRRPLGTAQAETLVLEASLTFRVAP